MGTLVVYEMWIQFVNPMEVEVESLTNVEDADNCMLDILKPGSSTGFSKDVSHVQTPLWEHEADIHKM